MSGKVWSMGLSLLLCRRAALSEVRGDDSNCTERGWWPGARDRLQGGCQYSLGGGTGRVAGRGAGKDGRADRLPV